MQLGMFIIERHQIGEPDETVFLPICDGCGEPITDFNAGNLIAVDPEPPAKKTKQLKRKLDGRPLVEWTCADMHFVTLTIRATSRMARAIRLPGGVGLVP